MTQEQTAGGRLPEGAMLGDGEPVPAGGERGEASPQLKSLAEGGILDTGESNDDYAFVTEAAPERGLYRLVGGYVDRDGVLHKDISLRALSGNEEDLLANENVEVSQRLNEVMVRCTERIGAFTDEPSIRRAIQGLPMGSRTDLLIDLRVTSHWRRHKDIYEMKVACPINKKCGEATYSISLLSLGKYEPEDPARRIYTVELADAKQSARLRVGTTREERIISAINRVKEGRAELFTYATMVRLEEIDGDNVRLEYDDILSTDGKKLKLNKKAQRVYKWLKSMTSADRDDIREEVDVNEPGVDTEIEFECKTCGGKFSDTLDISQVSFFFPSAASKRSRKKYSS